MRSLAIAVCVLGLCSTGVPAAPPLQDHVGHAGASADASSSVRRATDAPLREGMRRVRDALDQLHHCETCHMTPDMARQQAIAVENAVAYMFANCKLASEADASLHGILLPLLAAAQRLHKEPSDKGAIAAMRDALAAYPRRFDDRQWQADEGDAAAH
jgi:hypothetical protein